MNVDLAGKVALVTGAGSGFGAAIAAALAHEGCATILADLDFAAAERVVASLSDLSVSPLALDVGDAQGVARAVDRLVGAWGHLDILVNSAGILKTGSVLGSSVEDWEQVSRVNLTGVLNCTRAAAAVMTKPGWGRIINIASVAAMRGGGSVGNTLYGATKAGVVALTMGLARELGPFGITVNAIAPGVADTAMTRAHLSEEATHQIQARIPLRRLARPEDVAHLACFLASEPASYITGTVIPVDGGILTT